MGRAIDLRSTTRMGMNMGSIRFKQGWWLAASLVMLLSGMGLCGCMSASADEKPMTDDMMQFQESSAADWQPVFYDSGTNAWQDHWVLDGLKASVENTPDGMVLAAGPVQGDDSCHAVLWTKQSFSGDVRIDYEYTKLDDSMHNVIILYMLASGSGEGAFSSDIFEWSKLREIPSMRLYFNHMNTYHISYSAYAQDNADPADDYIRARRYMPETGKGLLGTDLEPDYLRTGFFATGVPHRMTVIKKGDDLFMHVRNDEKEMLCHWKTDAFPPITEGRIGLRHMYTRSARYRDFRVSILSPAP